MSTRTQNPWIIENLSSGFTYKQIPEKQMGKNLAILVACISTIQGIAMMLQTTFYMFRKSASDLENSLSKLCNWLLGHKVIDFSLPLQGSSVAILVLVLIYVMLVLSITVIYWTSLFQKFKIYVWIKSYYQFIMHLHFYCISLPVNNVLMETVIQAFGGVIPIRIVGIFVWIINVGVCIAPFFKALNTKTAHPLAIIDDKFIMLNCFAKIILSQRDSLIISQDLFETGIIAMNLSNLASMICHKFMFFYAPPFVQEKIRNIFTFQVGIMFLLAVSNFLLGIFHTKITKASGLLAIIIVILIMPVYFKFMLNWMSGKTVFTGLAALSYAFEDAKKQSLNRYYFIHAVYRLKNMLEYTQLQKSIHREYNHVMLRQFGMSNFLSRILSEDESNFESAENRLRIILPRVMSCWQQRHPEDHLVGIVQAELMVEELQLIHGSYTVLQNLLRNKIKRNLRLRALEIQDTFQSLIKKMHMENPTVKLAPFFGGFKLQLELKKRIISQVDGNSRFYQRIQDKEPDLLAIMTNGQKALGLRKDVTGLWSSIPDKLIDSNFVLLLIYGFYKIYVNYEYQEGRELLEKYFKYAAKRQGLKTSADFNEKTLSCDDNGLILINTDKSAFGHIVYCNKTVEKIFGRKLNYLVDKNLKILMPSFFQDIHDTFLMRKLAQAEDLLKTRAFPSFAIDSEGFVFPVNILTTIYPWVNKGFLFAGIIRKFSTNTHYILLDEQCNINCYSKSLMKRLNLPLPFKMDKISIFSLCRSINGLTEPVSKSQFSRVFQDQGLPSSYGMEEDSFLEHPDMREFQPDKYKKEKNTTLYSFDLRKATSPRRASVRGSPLLKSPGGENDLLNFYPYGKGLKKSKTPRNRKILDRANSKDQATLESKSERLIQFKYDLVTQRYFDKELKILALDDVIPDLLIQNEAASQEASHLNVDSSRRSSLNFDSEKELNKEKFHPKPRSVLSQFSKQPRLVHKELVDVSSQKPMSSDDDSHSFDDMNSSNEEHNENSVPILDIKKFPSKECRLTSRGNKETIFTEMNLIQLETTNRNLLNQSQSDLPISTLRRRHSDVNEISFGAQEDNKETEPVVKKREIGITPLKLQEDTLISPASTKKVPLIKKITKQISFDEDSNIQDFAEDEVDYKGDNCIQFLQKHTEKYTDKSKASQLDMKIVSKSLPFAKFSQARIPVHFLLVTLIIFLAACIYTYSLATSNLPAVEVSFSALRESLDRVIILADVNYKVNSMQFFLYLIFALRDLYISYQQGLQDDVNKLIILNSQIGQKLDVFSSDFREFIYSSNIQIYVDNFGNYSSSTNYLILDSKQALDQVILHASQVAKLPYTETATITNHISFLMCNMFNDLLTQLTEEPSRIYQEILRFSREMYTATRVGGLVGLIFFASAILVSAAVYVKSYIDTRNFLEHFLYFDQNRIMQSLNNADSIRRLVESNLQDKSAFHSLKQRMRGTQAKEPKVNWDKDSKVNKLKVKILKKVLLIIIVLMIPILIIIITSKSYGNDFNAVPQTLDDIVKPKKAVRQVILILCQLGIYAGGFPYKIYDRDVKSILVESIADLDESVSEAEMPTTPSNFALLHGDLCQFVNPANVTLCKGLLQGASSSGLVGSILTLNSFAKLWKKQIDSGNPYNVPSNSISNNYVYAKLVAEAINTVEAQQADQLSTYFSSLKQSGLTFMILSSFFGFIVYLFDVGFLYLPSKKEREEVSQLILLVPLSVVLSNNRLKLYLRKNSGMFRDATKPK